MSVCRDVTMRRLSSSVSPSKLLVFDGRQSSACGGGDLSERTVSTSSSSCCRVYMAQAWLNCSRAMNGARTRRARLCIWPLKSSGGMSPSNATSGQQVKKLSSVAFCCPYRVFPFLRRQVGRRCTRCQVDVEWLVSQAGDLGRGSSTRPLPSVSKRDKSVVGQYAGLLAVKTACREDCAEPSCILCLHVMSGLVVQNSRRSLHTSLP